MTRQLDQLLRCSGTANATGLGANIKRRVKQAAGMREGYWRKLS